MKDLQERGRGDFVVNAVCDANSEAANERADMLEELLGERPTVYGTHQELSRRHKWTRRICAYRMGFIMALL